MGRLGGTTWRGGGWLLIEAAVLSSPAYLSAALVASARVRLPGSYFVLLFLGCYALWAAGMRHIDDWLREDHQIPYLARFAAVGGILLPACAVLVGQTLLHALLFAGPRRMFFTLRALSVLGWSVPVFILPLAALVVTVGRLRLVRAGALDPGQPSVDLLKMIVVSFAVAILFRFFWEGPAATLAKLVLTFG